TNVTLNRVEAAVQTLAAELNAAGYAAAVEPVLKGSSRLPSGYTELEYIQSSGTQYVDTGMKTTNETSIIIDAQVLAMNQEQYGGGLLFGSCNPGQNSGHEAYVWQYKFNAVYNSTANVDTQTLTVGDRLRVEFMKNVCTVIKNGQVFYTHTFSPSSFTSTVNLYLFVLPRSTQYFGKIKLYSCEIYEGSSLVRKFIPCKNPAGAVGLYDTVNGTFYGNSGTGVFTAGAEIGALEDREWRESDIVRLSQWQQYLANVQALRDAYYTLAETGQLPDAADRLDYAGANNIEKILADIDLLIGWMKSSYRRCGTFQAGNNAAHLPLKGSA
ncbi:MAG: hypothetical protein ACI4T6_03690, partial [Candidatus Flemingiibacterium sp.]